MGEFVAGQAAPWRTRPLYGLYIAGIRDRAGRSRHHARPGHSGDAAIAGQERVVRHRGPASDRFGQGATRGDRVGGHPSLLLRTEYRPIPGYVARGSDGHTGCGAACRRGAPRRSCNATAGARHRLLGSERRRVGARRYGRGDPVDRGLAVSRDRRQTGGRFAAVVEAGRILSLGQSFQRPLPTDRPVRLLHRCGTSRPDWPHQAGRRAASQDQGRIRAGEGQFGRAGNQAGNIVAGKRKFRAQHRRVPPDAPYVPPAPPPAPPDEPAAEAQP